MYLKNQMVVFIIMELLINELLVDIVLILKNGLKIKILFVGVVDYLNIKIIFLPVDKMTASDYTHLFGYLNPYYRSAYNVSKRRK